MVTGNPQPPSDEAAVILSFPRGDQTTCRRAPAPHLHVRTQLLDRFRLLFAEQADGRGGVLLPVGPVAAAGRKRTGGGGAPALTVTARRTHCMLGARVRVTDGVLKRQTEPLSRGKYRWFQVRRGLDPVFGRLTAQKADRTLPRPFQTISSSPCISFLRHYQILVIPKPGKSKSPERKRPSSAEREEDEHGEPWRLKGTLPAAPAGEAGSAWREPPRGEAGTEPASCPLCARSPLAARSGASQAGEALWDVLFSE